MFYLSCPYYQTGFLFPSFLSQSCRAQPQPLLSSFKLLTQTKLFFTILLLRSLHMAALVLLPLLILASMTGCSSAAWCICKKCGDAVLQKTLDYACGQGADCNPIHAKGPCFNPDNVRAHCNYAVNSYFQKKGQAPGTCDFAGTATVTASDPGYAGCAFPASASAAGATTTPKTTPSSTTSSSVNPINNTPASTTPYGSTTPTGTLGGVGNGLGPSGSGMNPYYSTDGGFRLHQYGSCSYAALLFTGLMLLRG